VREITGATIQETVPDSVLDDAEIELVDLPPGELLQRLAEGKVYVPERAQAASLHFFREGNLTALRELALRLGAEHVGQDVRDYLAARQIPGPWKTGPRLLVAISPSPLSESMARWTRRLADNLQAPWLAVYVDTGRGLTDDEQSRLQKNLNLARELGAEVQTTNDADVVRAILRVARQNNVSQIVAGKPVGLRWLDLFRGGSVLNRLIRESGSIDVLCVRAEHTEAPPRPPAFHLFSADAARQCGIALVVVAATTIFNLLIERWVGPYSVSMVYLLVVIALALTCSRGPMLLAATVSALAWNFLFLTPLHTFFIASFQDALMFLMFFVVALAMGQLTSRIRAQQVAEREREVRATALYLLTRELAEGKDLAQLLGTVVRQLGDTFKADVALFLPEAGESKALVPYPFNTFEASEKEQSVAVWAFANGKPAGWDTDTLPMAEALHLPLVTPAGSVGVVGLKPRKRRPWSLQQRTLLDNFVRQIALVLDRQRLSDVEHDLKLVAESERLGKTLLNSISHELRTPIAAIASAASGLGEESGEVEPTLRRALVVEIREASQRLNRLVGNLLDMTRLESGRLRPRLEWCDVADLVSVTRQQVDKELAAHHVTVAIAPGLPLVQLDFVLMEQVLANLLLNAAMHTPPGTAVQIRAAVEGKELVLAIGNNGPGISGEALPHIFNKFYRGPSAPVGGSGLGLSIVKGFVEAHGGKVSVQNRPGGGAEFVIRLPLTESPSVPVEAVP